MKLMRVAEEDEAQGGSLCGRSTRLFHTLISGAGRVLGKIPQIFFFAGDPTGFGPPGGGYAGPCRVVRVRGTGRALRALTVPRSRWLFAGGPGNGALVGDSDRDSEESGERRVKSPGQDPGQVSVRKTSESKPSDDASLPIKCCRNQR
jgi:hypothetical protein